jgi:hypothetical protein
MKRGHYTFLKNAYMVVCTAAGGQDGPYEIFFDNGGKGWA